MIFIARSVSILQVMCLVAGIMPLGSALAQVKPEVPSVPPAGAHQSVSNTLHPDLERRLEVIDAATAKLVDFKADFEQKKFSPLLKKPMVSSGVLTSKGRLVRWETTQPRHVIILIDPDIAALPAAGGSTSPPLERPAKSSAAAGEIRVYYPDDKLCEIYPAGGALSDFAGAPLPRLSDLRTRFSIASMPVSDMGGGTGDTLLVALRLTPLTGDVQRYLESIMVLIDESVPSARKVVVTDAEGERTEISMSAIKINSGVKDSDVALTLPDDVRMSRPLGKGAASSGATAQPKSPAASNPATPISKPPEGPAK